MAVEDIIETIGTGGDHTTIDAWKSAYDGEDLTTGGVDGDGRRIIGEVLNSLTLTTGIVFNEDTAGTVTSATQYRWLRAASGQEFDPLDIGSGAEISTTSSFNSMIRVKESFFRISSLGFSHEGSGSGFKRCIRVDKPGVVIERVYGYMANGINPSNAIFQTSVGLTGGDSYFLNCIAQGEDNQTVTAGGAHYGFSTDATTHGTAEVHLYHCDAYEVIYQSNGGGAFDGVGIEIGDRCRAVNCIAIGNGNAGGTPGGDFYEPGTPLEADYNLSGDTTATGANSVNSESEFDTWEGPNRRDFSLLEGTSLAINAGEDRSANWPSGVDVVDYFGDDHDNDGEGWDMGAVNQDTRYQLSAVVNSNTDFVLSLDANVSLDAEIDCETDLVIVAQFLASLTRIIDHETDLVVTDSYFARLDAEIDSATNFALVDDYLYRPSIEVDCETDFALVVNNSSFLTALIDCETDLVLDIDGSTSLSAEIDCETELFGVRSIMGVNTDLIAEIDCETDLVLSLTDCDSRTITPTTLDEKLVPKALSLIQRFGHEIDFIDETVSFDAVAGTISVSASTTYSTRVSPPERYLDQYVDGDTVQFGDARVFVPASGLAFAPTNTMRVEFDGTYWRIVSVDEIWSGEQRALYEVQIRGGGVPQTISSSETVLDQRLVTKADDLIARFGKTVDFHVFDSTSFDAAAGTVTELGFVTHSKKVTPPEEYQTALREGDTALLGELEFYVPAKDIEFVPFKGQTVLIDCVVWEAIAIETVYSGYQPVLYRYILSK